MGQETTSPFRQFPSLVQTDILMEQALSFSSQRMQLSLSFQENAYRLLITHIIVYVFVLIVTCLLLFLREP